MEVVQIHYRTLSLIWGEIDSENGNALAARERNFSLFFPPRERNREKALQLGHQITARYRSILAALRFNEPSFRETNEKRRDKDRSSSSFWNR